MVHHHQQVGGQVHLGQPGAETGVRAQAVRGVPGADMLLAGRLIAVDVEFEGIGKEVIHVVRCRLDDEDPPALGQFVALDLAGVRDVPHRQRDDRVQAHAFHDEPAGDVGGRPGERLSVRVAAGEHGIGFITDLVVELRLRQHVVGDEAELVADVHAGDQRSREHEPQIRLRQELPIVVVHGQQVVGQIPRAPGPLGGCVAMEYPLHHLADQLRPAPHARGLQHELGQSPADVRLEGAVLELVHVVDDVLRVDADRQRRHRGVDQLPAHVHRRAGVSDPPSRNLFPRV